MKRLLIFSWLCTLGLAGCTSEEPQKINSFKSSQPTWFGPWRTQEPISFYRDRLSTSYRVTTVLSDPEVLDRPYPMIRMPWIKKGNEITEQAYCEIVGDSDSLRLSMNARDHLLRIWHKQFQFAVPLGSFETTVDTLDGSRHLWRYSQPAQAPVSGQYPRLIEFTEGSGLTALHVNEQEGTTTRFLYNLDRRP